MMGNRMMKPRKNQRRQQSELLPSGVASALRLLGVSPALILNGLKCRDAQPADASIPIPRTICRTHRPPRLRLHHFAFHIILSFTSLTILSAADAQQSERRAIKHQITGLFQPDREQDLKDLFEKQADKFPGIKLVSIDFANAEATFDYDPAKVFPGAKPEQIVERFDNLLRDATRHTFGVKPLCPVERDKLKRIEIPVVGLDCKACSLAAYEMVYKLKGVEMATASFKTGKVTAWIDPEQIDQAEIEMVLKQRGVQLVSTSEKND